MLCGKNLANYLFIRRKKIVSLVPPIEGCYPVCQCVSPKQALQPEQVSLVSQTRIQYVDSCYRLLKIALFQTYDIL